MSIDKIRLVTGNLTNYPDADAIVNAANNKLQGGNGVCGAIFKAAGWDLMQESCNEYPMDQAGLRCPTGDAVATPAHGLPNKVVIHAVGPIYNPAPLWDTQNEEELASAYTESLAIAHRLGLKRIAFPAISCGIFGYPLEEAASVSLHAVKDALVDYPDIEQVDFVFLPFGDGPEVQAAFEASLASLRVMEGLGVSRDMLEGDTKYATSTVGVPKP